jgi:CHRD domain/FG-GAP-like repeat
MYKRIINLNFVIIFVFAAAVNAQQKFVANMNGSQFVPATNSAGKGVCKFTLNSSETNILIDCAYSNLPLVTNGFLSLGNGSVGQTGGFAIGVSTGAGGTSGSFTRNLDLTPQQVADFRANKFYAALITGNSPASGGIRGQIHVANGTYNDYDGDSRADLVVYRSSNSTYYSLGSLGRNYREQNFGTAGGSSSLNADYDGDGLTDFSIVRTVGGQNTWFIFQSETNTLRQVEWGNQTLGDFFASADYDGDGKFDIATYRAGVWYIIESSTGNARYEYFGQSADVPCPNDYDKDGRWDLAVARNEGGVRVWYARLSSTGQFRRIEFGISSDAFFTGRTDFDGDGTADILVIRTVSGQRNFYILRSSDNQLQVIPWGLSSDLPKLADYDGDGKTDPTVNRNLNGEKLWFILQSANNQPRYDYFGLSSDF